VRATRILLFYVPKMASLSPNLSLERTNQSAKPTKLKAQSLKDILHEFGPIKDVSYTLF
jgi:hypothetical protein